MSNQRKVVGHYADMKIITRYEWIWNVTDETAKRIRCFFFDLLTILSILIETLGEKKES